MMDRLSYNELVKSIDHWNEYRVPILKISAPDRNFKFHGAMRFYFQDAGQKVATKCVNVNSDDTTEKVIGVLIEKFRADMRMLTKPEPGLYGIYEIHENGDERKLGVDERPLFVQLDWNKDDREGRFLLRRMDEKTRDLADHNDEPSLKKLSKKEKKKQEKAKKQQLKELEKAEAADKKLAAKNKNGIAQRLYNELPETSFTRSISNPEAVMKRRRAQKLEKRLQEFSLEGGQKAGGTLRIFGEAINKDVSYKTLLLSTEDQASSVVKQILEKYGLNDEDPANYCLVQLIVPASATSAGGDNNSVHDLNTSVGLKESILDDTDCPLLINQTHDKSKGLLTFHIRHKPADYRRRSKKKPPRNQMQQNQLLHPSVVQQLNQRLQISNNLSAEQYSNQNSPQNSSQTSGSVNFDPSHPPPPSFETVHSMPNMYPASNGNMMPYHHQQAPLSMNTTLPARMGNHFINNNHNNMHVNGTMQRQNYMQQSLINNGHQGPFDQAAHPIGRPTTQQMMSAAVASNGRYPSATGANDQILPALIQVREEVEDIFLSYVITRINPAETSFRLAPTYVLYMVSRYRASTLFHPELSAYGRVALFIPFTRKIATMIRQTIEEHQHKPTHLAFWLANSSDLSHFYKQDKHLSPHVGEAQRVLFDSIKASFKYLLTCKQLELDNVLNAFFEDCNEPDFRSANDIAPQQLLSSAISPILSVLNDTMATMRKNRVNAALTIQIFSHLFHHTSKWLFDRLIGVYDTQTIAGQPNFAYYCNRLWGERLNARLATIVRWAEKQGLEQAADYYLARVNQLTMFLSKQYPPKITPHDLQEACDLCPKINPVQMRALLQRYQPENPTLRAIIENALYTMDYSYMADEYTLEEDYDLKTPFLIPEDGYSSEMIRYIPAVLLDFVSYLSKIRVGDQELCIFTVQPTSSGFWTVYFKNHQPDVPEVIVLQLRKKDKSMGLSIIAARGTGQSRMGIYIKNVFPNGSAALDGRLQAGDQLLEVDGNSLININQDAAAELMQRTGPTVNLKIAKQAAIYHNLSDVINSPPSQVISPQQMALMQQQHHHIQHPSPPQQPQQHFDPPAPIGPAQLAPSNHSLSQLINNSSSQTVVPPPHIPMMQPPPQQQQRNFEPPAPIDPSRLGPELSNADTTPNQIIDTTANSWNSSNPIKSPKKVSWVDTQPHQSLHTLIPPSPNLNPSPTDQIPSPPPGVESSASEMIESTRLELQPHLSSVEMMPSHLAQPETDYDLDHENNNNNNDDLESPRHSNQNGQLDATSESLTLEDIDEVLSSKTHNNWLEDSAGVIGTQEVYNDPRQRIVSNKEREKATSDVNTEKLTFKEKLKMFNLSQGEKK